MAALSTDGSGDAFVGIFNNHTLVWRKPKLRGCGHKRIRLWFSLAIILASNGHREKMRDIHPPQHRIKMLAVAISCYSQCEMRRQSR